MERIFTSMKEAKGKNSIQLSVCFSASPDRGSVYPEQQERHCSVFTICQCYFRLCVVFGWDSGKSTGVRIRYTMCEASCPHRERGKQASGSCFGAACAIFRDRCGMSVGGTPVLWKPLRFGWNCLLKNVRNPAYERLWWSVPKVPTGKVLVTSDAAKKGRGQSRSWSTESELNRDVCLPAKAGRLTISAQKIFFFSCHYGLRAGFSNFPFLPFPIGHFYHGFPVQIP